MATFDVREYFKKWPRFYYFVAKVFGPLWWSGLSAKKYIESVQGNGSILNLGSGPLSYKDKRIINVDITPYPNVTIVAPADQVPLPTASIHGIILDNVMEHVKNPSSTVKEIARLLAPGGTVYIAWPFLYPFHSSPSDYSRWTINGLRELLGEEFEIIKSGVRNGPFSALTSFLTHLLATLFSFGNAALRSTLFNIFMIPLMPLKILDIVFANYPGAEEVSAVLYVVAKRK